MEEVLVMSSRYKKYLTLINNNSDITEIVIEKVNSNE